MNLPLLIAFKNHQGDIHVPAGINLIQGHIIISYPEYKGPREKVFEYYDVWGKDNNISESNLNDTMYTIVYSANLNDDTDAEEAQRRWENGGEQQALEDMWDREEND